MANSRRAVIGWSVLFGYLCVLMLSVGVETALHFLGPAIDGPFQLYNALRRITVGQRPGVDFQFFHGVLIPYLHYPFFRLFGGGFTQSEVTRQVLSAFLYPATILLFLKFFLRDWTRAVAWSAIALTVSIALRMTSVLVAINSLLGIRSMLPVLLPVVLCLDARRWVRVALAGLTIGGSLLLGTEQGLAAIGALLIVTAVLLVRTPARRELAIDTAAILAVGVATLVIVLTLLGGVAGMRSAIHYNFRTVPMDQYWYFGSPPNLFISSWSAIPSMLASMWRMPLVAAVGLAGAAWFLRELWRSGGTAPAAEVRRTYAFSVALVYGLLSLASLLGIYANAYIQPLERVLVLIGAVLLAEQLPVRDQRLGRRMTAGIGQTSVGVAIASILLMIVIVPSAITNTIVTVPHTITDHLLGRERPVYAGIWPATIEAGQAMVDSRRAPDGTPPTLWSTYAGLLEARNGLFQPSTDYIIHALGPDGRAKYLDDFKRVKPRLVQTVSPLYTQYETWIEATSWDFYAELLRNYRVVGGTEWSLFWERLPQSTEAPKLLWQTFPRRGTNVVELPFIRGDSTQDFLIQIEMDYETRNPLHVLPVVGAMPRYLVETRGALQRDPVSLDPYVTQTRFPLVVTTNRSAALRWEVLGLLPDAGIEVKAVRMYSVPVTPANRPWFDAVVLSHQSRIGL